MSKQEGTTIVAGVLSMKIAKLEAENERLSLLLAEWSLQWQSDILGETDMHDLCVRTEQALTNGGPDANTRH